MEPTRVIIMRKVSKAILSFFNYHIDTQNIPVETQKCVLLFAPHTSWRDFIIGKLALHAMGVKTAFLIKKEMFFFPFNYLLKAAGAHPVNRQNPRHFMDDTLKIIQTHEKIALLISPEGTRKKVKWKRGFYSIATQANIPIVLGYLDYVSRKGGVGKAFYPTGDYEKDLQEIEKFYYGMRGRFSGQFNLENKPYAHPDWLQK